MKKTDYGKLAATLKILADSLPEMMSAMLRPDEERKRPMAGITDRIAAHLHAEVCSIFLGRGEGEDLVCREAYGYAEEVEGKTHSINEGLTGCIFRDQWELVLNYSVQDETLGWVGSYDKELKTHCWSLLGVPIISSQQTGSDGKKQCLGVLKLENKRRMWSAMCDGEYLKKIAERNNTPQAIYYSIEKLSRGEDENSAFYKTILPLAQELIDCAKNIRTIIQGGEYSAERMHIMPINLEAKMESVRWHTECLHHEIDEHIQSGAREEETKLAKMIHALHLALQTYEPFSDEDLMLARHVAAMLAAVLDIDLIVYFKGWERIAHSLNHVSSDFLEHLERIIEYNLTHQQKDCFTDLRVLLDSAIYISGTKGSLAERHFQAQNIGKREARYIAVQVRSRTSSYRWLARLSDIRFKYRQEIKDERRQYRCDSGQLKAGLDVIVHNAFRYGAKQIDISVFQDKDCIKISVQDDGVGLSGDFSIARGKRGKKKVKSYDGKLLVPSGEGMGLFNTRVSLATFGAILKYYNSLTGCGAIFEIVLPNSCD